ncbi:MAG: hypothetical protein F6K44_06665 [Moorea sp. SIO3E2]|uniref:Uncharacterized protein n=2 Tax=Moorena TaxID=1155738 RepID=F4XJT7_9CYAN|nr:hypothetical protein [Moorena producens]EGJ35367.1 hypothetical protein LYNGBM3L_07190 [Moorena producens 3L]NEQ13567.1 hypothetical protein [Moorena sp. SIO3E2]OLT65605.1 hypothetical protein BI334_11690 [Moorena producens 3L]
MYNPKTIKGWLVGLVAIPLIWSAYCEYEGKPFTQASDVINSLVQVTVLVDALLKQEDPDNK